ncbi:MAG TPA: dihydrofolate reductase [Virgibacillus sp.]|nr:dihydrofolate reductase [Virgibacillus sp.]
MISLLVAMDRNRVIGFENEMPWHLPKDLAYFKEKTIGNSIIMGRKTFDSIGRVLPKRNNIVLTRSKDEFPEGVTVINDVELIQQWAAAYPDEEYFVIGGGDLFEQILPYADRMYITEIDEAFKGDTYFPEFSKTDWQLIEKTAGEKDDKNTYDYAYLQYDRRKAL